MLVAEEEQSNDDDDNGDNESPAEKAYRINRALEGITGVRKSISKFGRQEEFGRPYIKLQPKRKALPALHLSIMDSNNGELPKAFISEVYLTDQNQGWRGAYLPLACFVGISRTVVRFHKKKELGNNFSVGRSSFITFTRSGSKNKTLVIHICIANSDTRKDFYLDRQMQKMYYFQYKPFYRHALRILNKLVDDDLSIF